MKKVLITSIFLFLLTPFSMVSAEEEVEPELPIPEDVKFLTPGEIEALGAGEWDYAGQRIFYGSHRTNYNGPVNSGGGDFKITALTLPNSSGTKYELWEYDPSGGDDYVGSYTFSSSNNSWTVRGIGKFVDGDNGKAEFYLKTSNTSKVTNFVYYD